jgi:uncharacterized protein (DUF4415 family)
MNVKEKPSSTTSSPSQDELDPDDAPEIRADDLAKRRVVWRVKREAVSPTIGREAFLSALSGKARVNIHLDKDVIDYFKSQAGGPGYQTLINAALRSVMSGHQQAVSVEETIRKVIRDEFRIERERIPFLFKGVSTSGSFDVSTPSTRNSTQVIERTRSMLGSESTESDSQLSRWN